MGSGEEGAGPGAEEKTSPGGAQTGWALYDGRSWAQACHGVPGDKDGWDPRTGVRVKPSWARHQVEETSVGLPTPLPCLPQLTVRCPPSTALLGPVHRASGSSRPPHPPPPPPGPNQGGVHSPGVEQGCVGEGRYCKSSV